MWVVYTISNSFIFHSSSIIFVEKMKEAICVVVKLKEVFKWEGVCIGWKWRNINWGGDNNWRISGFF